MFSLLRSLPRQPALRTAHATRAASRSARAILEDDDTPVDLSEDSAVVDGHRPTPNPLRRAPPQSPTPVAWTAHRAALKGAFPDGWNPPRKLSREAMDGLRQLHRVDPTTFTTPVLAERFRVSPEAVRRILRSSWTPPPEKRTQLMKREAKTREAVRSLSALRQRMETRAVMLAKADMKAARGRAWEDDADDAGPDADAGADGAEPTRRGIHPRDKLAFE